MRDRADRNFILQQGLAAPAPMSCSRLSSALRFQPRLVGLVVLVGTISQLAVLFAALATLLFWCALLPRWNPFDLVYHHTLGARADAPVLGPAPSPRRFAQGMAATFAAAIAAALLAEWRVTAWVLQALLLLA